MKRKEQSMLLAGLLALGLAACTSTGMSGDMAGTGSTMGSTSDSGTTASATDTSGSMGSTAQGGAYTHPGTAAGTGTASMAGSGSTTGSASSGATAGTGMASGQMNASAGAAAGTPNSTVTGIEVVPRQSGGAGTGAGTVAGAAVGGANTTGVTGATMTGDRVYRITLRTDDGRTQTITQEWAPSFSTGDRVRMENGAIQR